MKARPLSLLAALAALTLSAAAVTPDPASFEYGLPLPLPADAAAEELYALPLPPALYAVVRENLADLRIADAAGRYIPFLVTRRTELVTVTQRVAVVVTRTGFSQPDGQNRIELVYEQTRSPAAAIHGLTLRTPLRDFERSITVEGSPDGSQWTVLTLNAVVFDASRFMDVSRKEVALPPAPHRFLRVTLYDVTDLQSSPVEEIARYTGKAGDGDPQHTDRRQSLHNRDFRIDGIDFWGLEVRESLAREKDALYPVTNLTVKTEARNKQTVLRFEAGRVPATRIEVRTGSRRFSRRASLYALFPEKGLERSRPLLAKGELRHIAFRTLDDVRLELAFPETRAAAYELVIENEDNPELDITGLLLHGPQYQALFFAAPQDKLRLLAGHPGAEPARFDTAALSMALDRGLRGRLLDPPGALERNPDAKRRAGLPFNRKGALAAALVIMVLVLGLALFSSMRKMNEGGA